MRHNSKGRKLGRTASHREATLEALSTALLKYKRIKTTVAKAKETRTFVEPLITKAKENSVQAKRHVARFIKDKDVVKELFGEIVQKIGERPGGYTRVVKLGRRLGDAAEIALIELVDYNEVANLKATENKEKKAEKKEKQAKEKAEEAKVVEETPQA
ncbi:MAG: 50S ribosomal protein L17 [Ignavibacteriales bacterium]|nr:MAG: 50S ribosomal protein L17 [Ignavibacteriales bacterium]